MQELSQFSSIDGASEYLLNLVGYHLSKVDLEYMVVGGWVPYLRGRNNSLKHPGTRDVDLLFTGNIETAKIAVDVLLNEEFDVSAKHDFQLFKSFEVNSKRFVFSVDLLHPLSKESPGLFHEILSLNVDDRYDPTGTRHVRSIAFPSSDIIFSEKLWSLLDIEPTKNNGFVSRIKIPLMDETGCIISKLESSLIPKRQRDCFDIYFLLSGHNGKNISENFLKICRENTSINEARDKFLKWAVASDSNFRKNIELFAPGHSKQAIELVSELMKSA